MANRKQLEVMAADKGEHTERETKALGYTKADKRREVELHNQRHELKKQLAETLSKAETQLSKVSGQKA